MKTKATEDGHIVGIYRYSENFRRMGELSGVFTATRDDIAAVMDTTVHLGEVLGKHSDITATVNSDTLKLLTEDKAAVDVVSKYGLSAGLDLLGYVEEDESDDEEEDDE